MKETPGTECPHCGCIDRHPCEQTPSRGPVGAIRRRRRCLACEETFYTQELTLKCQPRRRATSIGRNDDTKTTNVTTAD